MRAEVGRQHDDKPGWRVRGRGRGKGKRIRLCSSNPTIGLTALIKFLGH